jgi:hypothetical protein
MSDSIDQIIDQLPQSGLTVRALGALDYIVPGSWENVTGFDNSIQQITGETDPGMVARIRARALELFNDPSQGYQRALYLYRLADQVDSKVGLAALAHKVGESFSMLSFLDRITPSPEKAQLADLAMKVVVESVAFCSLNGFPGDSVSDFAAAVGSFEKTNLIRVSSIVVFDGLIPLGPDFARKLTEIDMSAIEDNALYQRLRGYVPENVMDIVNGAAGSFGDFAANHGITLENSLGRLNGIIEFSDDKLDYLAALLDMSVNYMEHTGAQSVARSLIERAVGEV